MEQHALSRRAFVGAAAAVPAAAWAVGGPEVDAAAVRSWAGVRRLFALTPGWAHLSAFILAPHPAPVRAAIERHRRAFDRDPRRYLTSREQYEERVASAAAAHLRTESGLIALTDSTTMGLGTVFAGLRLGAGDEILVSRHEHYSSHASAQLCAARTGATLREVELYPPTAPERASHDDIVAAIDRAIRPATKVVVVTWVHSSSGLRMPLRRIADVVGGRALLVVDAAHALGTGRIDVEATGADVLVAGTHKWLAGPRGTGLAWARGEAWERIDATIPSFRGRHSHGARMTPGGYHSFEHRWAVRDAFALHDAIGPSRIGRRVEQLAARLRSGLRGVPNVTVHAPDDARLHSGVVTFSIGGASVGRVVAELASRHRVHASITPYDVQLARLGTSWMNTPREVDRAIRAVRDLAS